MCAWLTAITRGRTCERDSWENRRGSGRHAQSGPSFSAAHWCGIGSEDIQRNRWPFQSLAAESFGTISNKENERKGLISCFGSKFVPETFHISWKKLHKKSFIWESFPIGKTLRNKETLTGAYERKKSCSAVKFKWGSSGIFSEEATFWNAR